MNVEVPEKWSKTFWKNEFKRSFEDFVGWAGLAKHGSKWKWSVWVRTDKVNPFVKNADVNECLESDWNEPGSGASTLEEALINIERVMNKHGLEWREE